MRHLIGWGIVFGIATWLYRSQAARERVRQWLGAKPVRQTAESFATAVDGGAQRLSGVMDATPLPRTVKDRTMQATTAISSIADRTRESLGSTKGLQPSEPPHEMMVDNPVPQELLAEQDAAARSAADALRDKQAGT